MIQKIVWERFYDNRLRGLVKGAAANLPEITFSRVSPRFSGLFSVVGVGSLVVGPSQWSLKGFIGYAPTKLTSGPARIGL